MLIETYMLLKYMIVMKHQLNTVVDRRGAP